MRHLFFDIVDNSLRRTSVNISSDRCSKFQSLSSREVLDCSLILSEQLTRKSHHRWLEWCRRDFPEQVGQVGFVNLVEWWRVQVLSGNRCGGGFWDQQSMILLKWWISLETISISWCLKQLFLTLEDQDVAPTFNIQRDSSLRKKWWSPPTS